MGVLMLNELQIDLIKQERDMAKAALKACRAECQKRGITSAEFAKMCGLRRVQLTVLTGAVPDTEPDFIEKVKP
jgi:sulfur relay (sulfurtransferase) complex TusBCD TusD component (DsrE family)